MEFYSGLGAWYFLRLCSMLLVLSSSPMFLLRLSIGTVQTMHSHLGPGRDVCLRLSRCIPTVSRRTLGTHGDDRGSTLVMLDHPCCQGDCFPASAIRHGRSVGPAVLPWRLYSGLCDLTRTLCWISRVAREIVFQPLLSDTEAYCTRRV